MWTVRPPGAPAVTRHAFGARPRLVRVDPAATTSTLVLRRAYDDAELTPVAGVPDGVELVRRTAEDGTRYAVVINHLAEPAAVGLVGHELLTGLACGPSVVVPAGDVRVVRELT